MKTLLVILIALAIGGCAKDYLHRKVCTVQPDGYQHCRHYVEYTTEPACIGSCAKP